MKSHVSPLPDSATLREAKDWLRGVVREGAPCPCCTQFAKVYRRQINSGMARSLIRMFRLAGLEFLHIPTAIPSRSREEGKLRYWGLVEEPRDGARPDGGRAGWWRVTPLGGEWVQGRAAVPKYALIFDDRRLGLEGPPVAIQQALGARFNLADLLNS